MALIDDIEKFARIERGLPGNPFFRRQFGQWAIREMQQREHIYSAVLEVFKGNTWNFVDPMPSESQGQARARIGRFEMNLLMSFMNKWNTLYTEAPQRVFMYDGKRLEDSDPELGMLQDQYALAHMDDIMEQSDTLMRLTGNVALRPWFDADEGEMVVHCYSGNNIRVIQNTNNPKRPKAIALVGTRNLEESDGGSVKEHHAEFFTPDRIGMIRGSEVTLEDLETTAMPVAFGFEKYPTNKSGFYVEAPGPALAGLDRLIANDFTTQLGFVTLMQGFGIPVTWGLKKGTKLRIGPDKTIDFDGDLERKEDVEFKSTNAPLVEITDVIKQMVEWIRETYDIPKTALDVTMVSSGVAQVEANAPLGLLRVKRGKQMRPLERRTVRTVADVLITANVITGSKSDPAKYDVAMFYPEPQISRSTGDQLLKDNFDLLHGITTPALLLMREQPDRFDSEDEAALFLASRRALLVPTGDAGGVESEVDSPALPEDTPPPVDSATVTDDTTDVADEAMNGAQVTALQGLVESVATGDLPASSAILVAEAAFPTIPKDNLKKMFEDAEKFEPSSASNTVLPPPIPADNQDGPDVDNDITDEDSNNA